MPTQDTSSLTDRATTILAGILANSIAFGHINLDEPDELAAKAVRIAGAIEDAVSDNRREAAKQGR